jgi:hypothetical protein
MPGQADDYGLQREFKVVSIYIATIEIEIAYPLQVDKY